MGILSSMFTGVSGLSAQGEALGVVSDNIANANTNGFKASRAEFADIVAKNLKGVLGGNQIGRGVKMNAVNQLLEQGNIDATEKATDLAISGDGYFVVRGGREGEGYTRDGSLHFDRYGFLVTNDDKRIQGFKADEYGKIVNDLGDIQFPRALTPAKETKNLKMYLNLDSRANISPPFNLEDPHGTAQFTTSVTLYDSQGSSHLVNMHFSKTADKTWEYHGLADGAEVSGGTPGKNAEVLTGKLTFNEDGKLMTEEVTNQNLNFMGGAKQGQQILVDFGDSLTTDKGKGMDGTKQFGKDSDIITWKQDGASAGSITNISINDDGVITGLYDNGSAVDIAQIAIAKFENPEGLFKVGNNVFKESRKSGEPAIGSPGASGRGTIFAKSLERSTVDLAMEFVKLIQNQRGFQANAKTITTTDELLAEVINLKR